MSTALGASMWFFVRAAAFSFQDTCLLTRAVDVPGEEGRPSASGLEAPVGPLSRASIKGKKNGMALICRPEEDTATLAYDIDKGTYGTATRGDNIVARDTGSTSSQKNFNVK